MKKLVSFVALVGLLSFPGCGGGDSDTGANVIPGEASSSFSGTYVPFEALAGVTLGETYGAIKAAHGNPDRIEAAIPDSPSIGSATYGPVTPWMVQFSFGDTDGNGVLSDGDTAWGLTGLDFDKQGIFKYQGIGTGNTEAEIIAVMGPAALRNVNDLDTTITSLDYQRNSWDFMMTFTFKNGVCYDILVLQRQP